MAFMKGGVAGGFELYYNRIERHQLSEDGQIFRYCLNRTIIGLKDINAVRMVKFSVSV
jgi:predicted phage gp36 major capsid-like protein